MSWQRKEPTVLKEIEREFPRPIAMECIYSAHHTATVLHKGTSYCRACYDDKNIHGMLIN
jgi:hypothetical protein